MDRAIHRRGNGYALSRDLAPRPVRIAGLTPLGRETRKHPPKQLRKLAVSLERFGFVLPILTDPEGRVVAGWALVLAAKQLGLSEVPAISLTDLSEAELRALRLALNRIAEDSAWDPKALALELSDILELAPQLDLELSGFEMGEIDDLLDGDGLDQEDELPPIETALPPVARAGDLWILDKHRLFCGDALKAESYGRVMGTEKADMMFADPALQRADRWTCLRTGGGQTLRFRHGVGRTLGGRVRSLFENLPRPCGALLTQRRRSFRVRGLEAHTRDARRRRRNLQQTH
jgi:hypothetical protein